MIAALTTNLIPRLQTFECALQIIQSVTSLALNLSEWLNKPGLLVRRATCAELEWRLVKEFWSGDNKIYDAYGIDRRRRIGQSSRRNL